MWNSLSIYIRSVLSVAKFWWEMNKVLMVKEAVHAVYKKALFSNIYGVSVSPTVSSRSKLISIPD